MNPYIDRFLSALEASNVITGTISLIVILTDALLFLRGDTELPAQLWLLTGIVIGAFFGGRAQTAQQITAKAVRDAVVKGLSDDTQSKVT